MAKILKLILSDIVHESRDKKEIGVLMDMGHDVRVLCVGNAPGITTSSEGYVVERLQKLNLRESKASKFKKAWMVLAQLYQMTRKVRKMKPDCVSCHDLIALCLAWVAGWFQGSGKPLLVYDSHEFEIGRNTKRKRGKLTSWGVLRLEKFLIRRSAFSMMVNDSIANEVQRIYHLKERPVVVRNLTPYWKVDREVCRKMHVQFCDQLSLPHTTFIVMYHGVLLKGRGIENMLRSIVPLGDVACVVLGNGAQDYLDSLKTLVGELNIRERVLFHEAVPIHVLWEYVGAANVGMVNIDNICLSYYYALPNKFFENIQSETPVIGSNFPEISSVIRKYNIGLCCDPGNVEEISSCILKMKDDKEQYNLFKQNLIQAKAELCWENEKEILAGAYAKILDKNKVKMN